MHKGTTSHHADANHTHGHEHQEPPRCGWYGRLALGWKLMLGFGAVLALTAGVGVVAYQGMNSVGGALEEVGRVRLPSVQGLYQVQEGAVGVRAVNAALMVEALPVDKRPGQYAMAQQFWKDLEEGWKLYEPLPQTTEEAGLWDKFLPAFHAWEQTAKATRDTLQHWDELRAAGKTAEAADKYKEATGLFLTVGAQFKAMNDLLSQIIDLNVKVASEAMDHGDQAVRTSRAYLFTGVVIAFGVGLTTALVLTRSITRRVGSLVERATAIADANLMGEPLAITSTDEIGRLTGAVNTMSVSLRRLIGDVKGTSQSVAAAATEIAASSEEMASTLKRQEEQAGQVSAAVTEMAASVTQVADSSTLASKSAKDSGSKASEGGAIVRGTITEMQTIDAEVLQAAKVVEGLAEQSQSIGKIIGIISDIADQTNLLALNAAIEAARAGEHGRGFAVVADEVRKLSERTTKATTEVSGSIGQIQAGTTDAVERIRGCTGKVKQGVEMAASAGGSLDAIVTSSGSLVQMVESIASAATQQAAASEEISRSMEAINSGTRESADAAGQAAKAAAELSSHAEKLQSMVASFRT